MLMFAIAETIGGYTVDELSSRMSVSEQREWKEYFAIKEEERKKETKKAKRKSRSGRSRRSM